MHATDNVPPLRALNVAAHLLTRLPLPALPDQAFDRSAATVWAFPVVGAGIGVPCMILAGLLQWAGLPPVAVAGVVLGALMMMTGAMHEDGLADTADGFWGGYGAKRRLEIMKDSHIGTYGVLALVVVTGLRWAAYAMLLPALPLAIPAAAAWSRGAMPVVMAALPHARATGLSRRVGRPVRTTAALGCALGGVIALACLGAAALGPLIVAGAAGLAVAGLARRKIGGQTGDVLGAVQQITETVFLLALAGVVAG